MKQKDLERFITKVQFTDFCWNWTAFNNNGYGKFWYKDDMRLAHRVAYRWWNGKLCPGLTVDHLCNNTLCVNPNHLDQVSYSVNVYRANGSSGSECKHGHSREIYGFLDSRGNLYCRVCANEAQRRYVVSP